MSETFASALARCIPEGESEEFWAMRHGLLARTLRHGKRRRHRFTQDTLRRLAAAMKALGGTTEERITRILRLTEPRAKKRRAAPAR